MGRNASELVDGRENCALSALAIRRQRETSNRAGERDIALLKVWACASSYQYSVRGDVARCLSKDERGPSPSPRTAYKLRRQTCRLKGGSRYKSGGYVYDVYESRSRLWSPRRSAGSVIAICSLEEEHKRLSLGRLVRLRFERKRVHDRRQPARRTVHGGKHGSADCVGF